MRRVFLRSKQGKSRYTFIDDEDYERVSKYKWYINRVNRGVLYAFRNIYYIDPYTKYVVMTTQYLHRFIMNPPEKMQVDHIDWNGLNNQKANLRIVTPFENVHHRRAFLPRKKKTKRCT